MNYNAKKILLCAFAQTLLISRLVVASPGNSETLLDGYQAFCQAQVELARCKKELCQFKLDAVTDLYQQDAASWLEWKRAGLAVNLADIKQQKLDQFNQFVQVVNQRAVDANYNEDQMGSVKVFLPGSNRLVGWLEGIEMPAMKPNQLKDAEYEYELRKNSLSRLKKAKLSNDDSRWNQQQQLKIRHASAQLRLAERKWGYLKLLDRRLRTSQTMPVSNRKTLRPEFDFQFAQTVKKIAALEARSNAEIRRIDLLLRKENRRLASIRDLKAEGHASSGEVQQIEAHVQEIRAALKNARSNHEDLVAASEETGSKVEIANIEAITYNDPDQWPETAFGNANQIQYLIQQRQACYIQQVKAETAAAKLSLNLSILERLQAAATSFEKSMIGKQTDRLGDLLKTGQQKEIADYESKIESLKLDLEIATEKIAVLKLEEDRFLQQVVLAAAQEMASDESENAITLELDPQWLHSMIVHIPATSKVTKSNRTVRFGYMESNLFDMPSSHGLVLLHSSGYPLGRFDSDDDLLRPVQLIDYSRRMSYSPSRSYRMQIGSSYRGTTYSNHSRYGNSVISNPPVVAPSLYNSPSATDAYRRSQRGSARHLDRAYPFGILRSDLRRFANPSQPPWYLPGSPNNLRYNQLRTNLTSPDGKTGNEILRSRNYSDLTPPYNRGW